MAKQKASLMHPVLTAYPHILAELTPLEVKILDFVVEHGEEKLKFWGNTKIDDLVRL